jgi:arylsulfatase A-like enzyme
MVFALGLFRVRRDVFHEELVLKSATGLGVVLGCAVAAVLVYLAVSATLRWLLTSTPARVMLRAWGSPVVVGAMVALIAIGAVLAGGAAEAAPSNGHGTPPDGAGNVLFIVVDTLRADHLPDYGYDAIETPHLSAFAEDAVRFDQAFANASWTRPSFASFLTGRFPSNHGVMAKSDQLPDEIITLPEALSAAGYYTTGVVTNYNVAPFFNFQQGFAEYRYLEPEYVLGADDAASKLLLVQFLRQRIEWARARAEIVEPGTAYRDAETVNREVFSFLDRAPERPFFVFAAYMDPHDPYFVHPYSGNGYARAAHQQPELREADTLRALYDGEIEYWDAQFGALIDRLKADDLYDDMTIIVTSDHGEEFGDHGGFWHGTTLYDEQVHVPLFVKLPGARRGGTAVGHWVQSVDVMPTLLAELGVDVPEGVQGGSLFEGTDVVYAEESHEGNVLESVRERRGTDEWKLITANPGNPRGLDPVELYRPDRDPDELYKLGSTHTEEVHALMETMVAEGAMAREGAAARQSVEMDAEAAQRLQNLGYMD